MEIFDILLGNFLTPPVLFFILGLVAGGIKSDLSVPESISRYLAIYLMMAIGFKGGVALVTSDAGGVQMIITILVGIIAGFLQPFIGYYFLRKTTQLDGITCAAVAAHYGSISMVTFVTAASFLKFNNVEYDGYIVAVLALMEAPAIVSALYIAKKMVPAYEGGGFISGSNHLWRDIFTNGAILLLFGAFIIGALTGQAGMDKMSGFLNDPFHGILALFLLDMGLLVAKQLPSLKIFNLKLVAFGIYMPILGGIMGIILAKIIGLSVGTGFLFAVLLASASYIAVPAAIRIALPQANPSIYLPLSLAITFPFNVFLGLPIYMIFSNFMLGN